MWDLMINDISKIGNKRGEANASILILLYGDPIRMLMVRKNCSISGRFSCDLAFPGGRIKKNENPIETALREAWEEVWVFPKYVKLVGFLNIHETISKPVIRVLPIVGFLEGPIDPMPRDPEIDQTIWIPLSMIGPPKNVYHPVRGYVKGVCLPGGLVVWGVSYRIIASLKKALNQLTNQETYQSRKRALEV